MKYIVILLLALASFANATVTTYEVENLDLRLDQLPSEYEQSNLAQNTLQDIPLTIIWESDIFPFTLDIYSAKVHSSAEAEIGMLNWIKWLSITCLIAAFLLLFHKPVGKLGKALI